MKTFRPGTKLQKLLFPALLLLIALLPLCWRWQNGAGYHAKILLIQLTAVSGGYLMMRRLYRSRWAVFAGAALYVTSPWRYDLCFLQNRLMLSLTWALLPWYLYFLLLLLQSEEQEKNMETNVRGKEYPGQKGSRRWQLSALTAVAAAMFLVAIGYGHPVLYCLTAALTAVLMVGIPSARTGKVTALLALAGSAVLWLPGNLDFLKYLLTDTVNEYGAPVSNITLRGYVCVDFLTTFAWQDGRPGLGLGVIAALALYVYMRFVREQKVLSREGFILGMAGFCSLVPATQYFPWELVQRLGGWALKFVSQMETPALFMGFAVLFLPAMTAAAVAALTEKK